MSNPNFSEGARNIVEETYVFLAHDTRFFGQIGKSLWAANVLRFLKVGHEELDEKGLLQLRFLLIRM